MIDFPTPLPLFNPLTAPADQALTVWEILAGPFGLIAFLPLIPILRLVARWRPRTALIACGVVWIFATVGPLATVVLLGGCGVGAGWVLTLARLRAREKIGRRSMIALVWIGLSAMLAPLWWYPDWSWYGWVEGSRLAVLHSIGFAYFYLRFIAWGVRLAENPHDSLRPIETICWLLYPPCMRLGPVLLREEFFERFDAWSPSAPPPWKEIGQRFGLFLIGGFLIGVCVKNTPAAATAGMDFFASPENYSTRHLVRVLYIVPIQLYLFLWTYNELAAALALSVGVRVDNNFNWAPAATSIRDYWRRFHITVGKWFRNYIYIPLGGNRVHVPLNYAAVFGFCAIWHGAAWSFLAWGASQALALTVHYWWDRLRRRIGWENRPSGVLWTALCWLLALHYQLAAILVFVDFEHVGWRFLCELWRRLFVGG